MKTALDIAGWALIGFAAIVAIVQLIGSSPDGGVRRMQRMFGGLLIVAILAICLLPVSNLFILLAFPIAFFLPMIIMQVQLQSAATKFLNERDSGNQHHEPEEANDE